MFQWLRNLFTGEKRSLENPAVPLWSPAAENYLGFPRSSSGVAVDRQSVLGYPAVWRCLNLVAGKIAKLPLDVYRHNSDGGREVDTEHPAHWLLSKRPSNLYTPHVWKKTLVQHALLHGNGFAWIIRDSVGRPDELLILNPEHTGISLDGGNLLYFTRIGQDEIKKILPENIIHLKGLSHDGLIGYSVIDALREAFGIGIAAQRYGSIWFRNNGSPGPFILKFPGRMDQPQIDQLREQWDKLHSGIDNSHRWALIANGGSVENFKIDNNTAQFLQTREFEVACGIASIFGVPASKLGIKINTSYGSLEQEEKAFLNDCLDDWLTMIEEEVETKLLKQSQLVRDSHYIEFDRRSLEQADTKQHADTLIALVNGGLLTENEARAELNRPAVSGGDGDRMRVPSNLVFVDQLAEKDTALSDNPQPAENTAGQTTDQQEPIDDNPVQGGQTIGEQP